MLFNISLTINSNSVYIAETYKQIMQKNCINYGIVIKNDTSDGRIANAIANVSIKDSYKTIIMATFFDETNNSDFRMFAFKNLSEEEKPTGWGIQVGAFKTKAIASQEAQRAMRLLKIRNKQILTPQSSDYYRARIYGFYSKKSAQNACRKLKQKKMGCLILSKEK